MPVEVTTTTDIPLQSDQAVLPRDDGQVDEPVMNSLETFLSFLNSNQLDDDANSSVLYQVHEDLRLVRKWSSMRVVRGATRNYLAGSAARAYDSVFPSASEGDDRTQVVVPISTGEMLSPRLLKSLCRECVHPETKVNLRCVTVAIVDDDSTTAYYRVFDQWDEIVHPQWKQKKKRQKHEDIADGAEEQDGKADSASDSADSASDSDSA